ncbi:MAG TPA: hypothetical protein VL181_07815, partial [Holophagaceae bacterium]|nr:hypothetical protein [Holophagaceae bacterium]
MRMLSLQRARMVADYLRAKAEVRRASLGTLVALLAASILAARAEAPTWTAHLWILAALVAGPWLLRSLPVRGNLSLFRLEIISFPLNVLLLGFIAFLEASRLPRIEMEGVPAMRWFFPALSMLLPLGYLLANAADWARRLKVLASVRDTLAVQPVEAYMEEPVELMQEALAAVPGRADAWSQFRTVPASARNLKLFLKLDTARHGVWRVAFSDEYALVVFQDGTGCEAVAPGGIQLAVDSAPR